MTISGLWAVLFLVDAAILALKLGGLATTAVFVFGALASIYGPQALVRLVLQRRIAAASEDPVGRRRASIARAATIRSTSPSSAPGSAA